MKLNSNELMRQSIHFSGVLTVVLIAYYDSKLVGGVLLALALLLYGYSEVAMKDSLKKRLPHHLGRAEARLTALIKKHERQNVRLFKGVMMFFTGVGLALVIFPVDIARLAVIVLAVGDSVSTVVGVHFGRHRLPVSSHRSWEGTLSGFVAAAAVGSIVATPPLAILAAFVGMSIEAVDTNVDDNILIPLYTGAVLLIVQSVPVLRALFT